ncbi:hypothetical protein [Brevundimonas sp.]|uniref:hypothetical protein n=1 Tax=Brevundimonas sp. TaxID=1871086 RepID=UPI00261EF8D2|nr:hypothetical protein [Brevundimonas sp.]
MEHQRTIQIETLQWEGITIEVSYEAEWLGFRRGSDMAVAHLQVRSVTPERAPLPITETGYRSHFVHPDEIDRLGGPVAYVAAWLDTMGRSAQWLDYVTRTKQLSLF